MIFFCDVFNQLGRDYGFNRVFTTFKLVQFFFSADDVFRENNIGLVSIQ